jgi:putative transport protein
MPIVLLVGHFVMRIPYDDLLGVASSGATGNPAILVYASRRAPTAEALAWLESGDQ